MTPKSDQKKGEIDAVDGVAGGASTDPMAARKKKAPKKAKRAANSALAASIAEQLAKAGAEIGSGFIENEKAANAVKQAGCALSGVADAVKGKFDTDSEYYDDKVDGLEDGTWD